MNISERGLDLIREFEGYLRPLKDGGCIAYRCPAGKWTLGWGCTKGIKPGMTWTKQQAVEGLRRELAECEAAVTRLVTVPIHQHQFDALVSFTYNCGPGALSKSTILRKLNRGDVEGAAAAFMMWNKARKDGNGKPVEMRGLTRRRLAERALFLTPPDDAEPEPMAQKVEEPPVVPPGAAAVGGAGIISGGAILADPAGVTSAAVAVKANAGQLLSGVDLALWGVPLVILLGVLAYLWWSRKP